MRPINKKKENMECYPQFFVINDQTVGFLTKILMRPGMKCVVIESLLYMLQYLKLRFHVVSNKVGQFVSFNSNFVKTVSEDCVKKSKTFF